MHLQPLFLSAKYVKKEDKDISSELFKNGICLPSGSCLSAEDQNIIIELIIPIL